MSPGFAAARGLAGRVGREPGGSIEEPGRKLKVIGARCPGSAGQEAYATCCVGLFIPFHRPYSLWGQAGGPRHIVLTLTLTCAEMGDRV